MCICIAKFLHYNLDIQMFDTQILDNKCLSFLYNESGIDVIILKPRESIAYIELGFL
jgi:hypothetical protein